MQAAYCCVWLTLCLVGCSSGQQDSKPEPVDESHELATPPKLEISTEALALIERFECNRCHEGVNFGEVALDKQCVGCHRQILSGDYDAKPELVAKWKGNIHSLPVSPSLKAIGKKLNRRWVLSQLLQPRDQRPGLEATMPRLALTNSEAQTMAQALVPAEASAEVFSIQSVSRGAELFEKYSCVSCHSFGRISARTQPFLHQGQTTEPSRDALALAPDLLLTRERFQSGQLVAWLMNPKSIDPQTLMPSFGFSPSQATSLAAYIWHRKTEPRSVSELPKRLPLLEREVDWSLYPSV